MTIAFFAQMRMCGVFRRQFRRLAQNFYLFCTWTHSNEDNKWAKWKYIKHTNFTKKKMLLIIKKKMQLSLCKYTAYDYKHIVTHVCVYCMVSVCVTCVISLNKLYYINFINIILLGVVKCRKLLAFVTEIAFSKRMSFY